MSSEIIAAIQNELAGIEVGLDEDTLAVAGSGANSKRISIKGGVFRKIVNGKEVGAIEERHMNIIFVKLAHAPSRTYYTKAYEDGVNISPDCWSTDSRVPDPAVKTPQAASCDKCPWSVKGTGQDGKGTACRLSWRTAVVLPNDPSGDVMQLVIPAASVFGDEDAGRWPFRSYVQMLASHNISAGAVVTKMAFDTKASAPRVLFNPFGAVPRDDLPLIKQQGASTAAENAVKMTIYQREDHAEPAAAAVPAETAAVLAQVKVVEAEVLVEPKLREPAATAEPQKDVADVIKKWASKKQG